MTSEQEEAQRQAITCAGCGEPKRQGLIVCWYCFKFGLNPYKYSKLSLTEWLRSTR
jgi:hypothetical protein